MAVALSFPIKTWGREISPTDCHRPLFIVYGSSAVATSIGMIPGATIPPITVDWPHCTADELRYTCGQVAVISTTHAPFAGYTWFFPSKGQTAYDHILSPNSQTPDCSYDDPASPESWNAAMATRSQHLGIVTAAFGDGSVHGISESIDVRVWRAMGTRAKQD